VLNSRGESALKSLGVCAFGAAHSGEPSAHRQATYRISPGAELPELLRNVNGAPEAHRHVLRQRRNTHPFALIADGDVRAPSRDRICWFG